MIKIEVTKRKKTGTSCSRNIRRKENKIPGVIYRKLNKNSSILISINHDIIFNLQKKKEFYNENITIILEKESFIVKLKAIQRHSFKLKILHIDFISVI